MKNNKKIINNKTRNFNILFGFFILSFIVLVIVIITNIYYTIEYRKLVIQNNNIKEKIALIDSELIDNQQIAMEDIFNNSTSNDNDHRYYISRNIDSRFAFVYNNNSQ